MQPLSLPHYFLLEIFHSFICQRTENIFLWFAGRTLTQLFSQTVLQDSIQRRKKKNLNNHSTNQLLRKWATKIESAAKKEMVGPMLWTKSSADKGFTSFLVLSILRRFIFLKPGLHSHSQQKLLGKKNHNGANFAYWDPNC